MTRYPSIPSTNHPDGGKGFGRCPASGFTLVELLVVIAIISILAGMLLPALQRARDSAQTVNCLNNMRQTSLSVITYSNDSDGYFPQYGKLSDGQNVYWVGYLLGYQHAYKGGTSTASGDRSPRNLGNPYINNTAVLRCAKVPPTDTALATKAMAAGLAGTYTGTSYDANHVYAYGMLGNYNGQTDSTDAKMAGQKADEWQASVTTGGTNTLRVLNLGAVRSASKMPMLAEAVLRTGKGGVLGSDPHGGANTGYQSARFNPASSMDGEGIMHFRHQSRGNVAAVDGHAEGAGFGDARRKFDILKAADSRGVQFTNNLLY